jgi:hypothetical protein
MTISMTASLQFAAQPRVLLNVSSSPSLTAVLRVFRVHADGSQHRVLTPGRAVLNGAWSGYDYHAPFNQTFTYYAQVGVVADSAQTPAVFMPSDNAWLMHPSDPDKSFPIGKILAPQQSVTRSSRATEFKILGSTTSVIRTDSPLETVEGSFTIRVPVEDIPTVETLIADDLPVLLNGPWGAYDYGWSWIWLKNIERSNSGGFVQFPTRNYKFDYQVVRAPDTDVAPVWTYADLTAEFTGNYSTLTGVWADYDHMSLDLRA